MAKQRWSDLSPARRTGIVVGALIELALTAGALRDLRRRPTEEVRGPKVVWLLLAFVQPVGPVLYLTVGRRRS